MVGDESLRVAVIIPAYRAADTIEKVIGGIPAWVDAIYVVDDASPDETAQALRDGVDICVKIDADDQMDPVCLAQLVEPLVAGRADYAKGNRFHDVEALRRMPAVRKLGNAGLSFLIKAASGQWHVFDPTNGYTAIHRAALAALDLAKLHPRYFFESSMLISLRRIDAVVEDVPISARYGDESSHLSITRAMVEFPWLLMRQGLRRILWQYFLVDFGPVSLFLLCGLPLVTFGAVFGLYHWIDSYRRNVLTPTGTVMLATLPMILGFQLLLQALVLDVQNVPPRPLQERLRPQLRAAGRRPANPPDR